MMQLLLFFKEVDQFNRNIYIDNFPSNNIKVGLYKLTMSRLKKLEETDPIQYDNLMDTDYIRHKIDSFKRLSDQV
jgi:hypothetical protein